MSCSNPEAPETNGHTTLQVFDTASNTLDSTTNITALSSNVEDHDRYNHMAVAPDGRVFVSITDDSRPAISSIVVFDAGGTEIDAYPLPIEDDMPQEMDVSPDGTKLAVGAITTGNGSQQSYIIDLSDDSITTIATDMASVAYSPDGLYLYGVFDAAEATTYRVIDTATNTEVDSIPVVDGVRIIVTPGLPFVRN